MNTDNPIFKTPEERRRYEALKEENEALKYVLKQYNDSVAAFVQGNPDFLFPLGQNCGEVLVEGYQRLKTKNEKLKAVYLELRRAICCDTFKNIRMKISEFDEVLKEWEETL